MTLLRLKSSLLLFFSAVLLASTATSSYSAADDLISNLEDLRSSSPSHVIRLTDDLLGRILALPSPRPFSFLIFFDAAQLHDKAELQLPTLKAEFSILAHSYYLNHHNDTSSTATLNSLFFFDIEFKDAQRSFSLFGVNSLPHVRIVTPNIQNVKDSARMDQSDFGRLADSMAEFVESKTKLTIGPLHRPPMFSGKQIALFILAVVISAPFIIKKVLAGETLFHDYKFWLVGSVFVYFFSVAGTMHNIIRKMPMFIQDREDPSRLVFFYQGSGMQLGAEGFAVGFLYTVVGLLLGFMTHGLVKVRSVTAQRLAMAVALIVSFWAVNKVVYLDNWKTGYGVHAYWPSSW